MTNTHSALLVTLLLACAAPAVAQDETLTGTVTRLDGMLVIHTDGGDQVELLVDGAAEHIGGLLGHRSTVTGQVKARGEEGEVMGWGRCRGRLEDPPWTKRCSRWLIHGRSHRSDGHSGVVLHWWQWWEPRP